nr:hypothetical protein BaRGS_022124 [Batillaria attramentaria]
MRGELLHCLQGEHLGVVRCLHINNERLVSGGDQKKICIWDYRLGKFFTGPREGEESRRVRPLDVSGDLG